jgi:hypothetical protein
MKSTRKGRQTTNPFPQIQESQGRAGGFLKVGVTSRPPPGFTARVAKELPPISVTMLARECELGIVFPLI